ncbi:MAG: hypothetical protein COV29_01910 [Candidatus Yanofskybacteria bacterium CG10_big_fil_rev_8_21_14_0_10_36_16]|uniref:Uncharacterized protein n=1 Tax=Candidatus Yanofskybacteria bacterium CG10_big_fil_rev_8_21_14_0_10_36_16 TaxID=1975096 RepID=A0A2J0QB36_9BACT|nr:MAG: hypothetical protein COV29_01910 [Candidatus Yanofskybacteria bacterium CG10_big_fil_rev_8_21_14_0_10_36_16]
MIDPNFGHSSYERLFSGNWQNQLLKFRISANFYQETFENDILRLQSDPRILKVYTKEGKHGNISYDFTAIDLKPNIEIETILNDYSNLSVVPSNISVRSHNLEDISGNSDAIILTHKYRELDFATIAVLKEKIDEFNLIKILDIVYAGEWYSGKIFPESNELLDKSIKNGCCHFYFDLEFPDSYNLLDMEDFFDEFPDDLSYHYYEILRNHSLYVGIDNEKYFMDILKQYSEIENVRRPNLLCSIEL